MNTHDPLFEPLLGKRRSVRQALTEVAERWASAPIVDAAGQAALEDAVRHKLLRGGIGREIPADIDAAALARAYVAALVAGQGAAAVDAVLPPRTPGG